MFLSYNSDNSPSTSWEFPLLEFLSDHKVHCGRAEEHRFLSCTLWRAATQGNVEQTGQGHFGEEEGSSERLAIGGERMD